MPKTEAEIEQAEAEAYVTFGQMINAANQLRGREAQAEARKAANDWYREVRNAIYLSPHDPEGTNNA